MIAIGEPSSLAFEVKFTEALDILHSVHDGNYIASVREACNRGQRILSPWDEDTYINRNTFSQLVTAQSAWMDAVDHVMLSSGRTPESEESEETIAFAVTRPPGHHASFDNSMGFCIFNFAVGAAHHAISKHNLERIAILDYDVHYGNGVADLVKGNRNIRYASCHQADIFPYGRGKRDEVGVYNNICNVPLPSCTKGDGWLRALKDELVPFLKDFRPQLLIVCAGYDGLASDELAQVHNHRSC